MRLEQLCYLVELSKFKSINIAAKHLYVSHQAISKAIQKLEKEFGVPLLNRSIKGISFTETGMNVVEIAMEIITKLEELEKHKLSLNSKTLEGNLSIHTIASINYLLLPDVVTAFCRKYRYVNVNTVVKSTSEIIRDIKNDEADVGLISILYDDNQEIEEKYSNEEFITNLLFNDKIIFGVGKSSPLAKRKNITMNELLKHQFILYQPTERLIKNHLKKYGEPNIILSTNSMELYLKSITEGLGIGVFTNLLKNKMPLKQDEINYLSIPNSINVAVIMIFSKHKPFLQITEEFVSILNFYYKDKNLI